MVEEDEGSDHLPLAVRQCAAYREAVAEIARARHDDEIERIAGHGIAEHGIVGGLPAHGGLLLAFLSRIVAGFGVIVAAPPHRRDGLFAATEQYRRYLIWKQELAMVS